ncbi:sigma-70 family RNA polymerase sigma factor [Bacillus sp. JJ1764]|uniref:sigma-70 family RNA polymerase sigma factor n=1 Tax=Bacillus sp. JJ1764 TaxID=3122964 RepID=UPI0030009A60
MLEDVNGSNLEPPDSFTHEEKLKWLMVTYGNDVIRIAYSYLKQKHLAEDVAQDVFIKCYEKMDTFRNESSYKTWLIKITINKCKDVLKSWSYKNLFMVDYFTFKNTHSGWEQRPEYENDRISYQVMKLPVKLREVIILYYYHEFSIEEIATLLKTNPNTIKTRLHRGRLKLKDDLEGV